MNQSNDKSADGSGAEVRSTDQASRRSSGEDNRGQESQPAEGSGRLNLSGYALIALCLLVGVMFYRIVQPFLMALVSAAILAVLFHPFHDWIQSKVGGHRRVAAGIAASIIFFLICLPIAGALAVAGTQLFDISESLMQVVEDPEHSVWAKRIDQWEQHWIVRKGMQAYGRIGDDDKVRLREFAGKGMQGMASGLYEKTAGLIANLIHLGISIFVAMMALYYFFADGDSIMAELHRLSPLGRRDEDKLIDRFGRVCRGVVMGSVVAGLAQAVLAGIGYAVADVPNVFLMAALTMFFSFVPFLGAGSVVTAISIYLAFDGRYAACAGLLIYGFIVVGSVDNIVKAKWIGTEASLHPLVALVSVIGAVQFLGLWGIFLGPMIAAFFYALLQLVRQRFTPIDSGSSAA
ncbi:AI-2E family transporter [Crateriforma conspicua]|uniref:Putative inner membrane protein n=1 Tax=Crateriforma conspicua TaxID=2527996 RepID=A0A5C5Y2L4_9PLAN|nr:AI-2E family transporter [Crateriforma conspicua]TWT69454.1 putative inner membrane protein [Crateriforma conspicua]